MVTTLEQDKEARGKKRKYTTFTPEDRAAIGRYQAGVTESAVSMGMPVLKEVVARWMTALYDNFCTKTHIIINGFMDTGIIEAVKRARK